MNLSTGTRVQRTSVLPSGGRVAVPGELFRAILNRIARLRPPNVADGGGLPIHALPKAAVRAAAADLRRVAHRHGLRADFSGVCLRSHPDPPGRKMVRAQPRRL